MTMISAEQIDGAVLGLIDLGSMPRVLLVHPGQWRDLMTDPDFAARVEPVKGEHVRMRFVVPALRHFLNIIIDPCADVAQVMIYTPEGYVRWWMTTHPPAQVELLAAMETWRGLRWMERTGGLANVSAQ